LWDKIKLKVRGNTVQFASRKKRSKYNILTVLQRRLTRLEEAYNKNPTPVLERDIGLVSSDIDKIIETDTKGAIIRSKVKWVEEGEKSTKYFLTLEKRNYNNKIINRLILPDNSVTEEKEKILTSIESFYTLLYTSDNNVVDQGIMQEGNTFLNNHAPKLFHEERDSIEGLVTEQELDQALKTTKNNKSPGTDGLPAEFYQAFWPDIKDVLLEALNSAYLTQNLSITQRQSMITLLPKKEKDPLYLKNWRPISLLNTDYKLLAKCIAMRIKNYIGKLIHKDQTGFIKGRYIGENIFRLMNIIDYVDEEDIESLFISVDFEKAFDFLEWHFVQQTLTFFNFGNSLKRWVHLLYTNITSCVTNNGWRTGFFKLTRGMRQGCPLSPYLFILAVEILAIQIRQDENITGIQFEDNEYKLFQFADDTGLTVLYSKQVLNRIIETFDDFKILSGLKVNFDKTEIMPLGPIKNSYDILIPEAGITWTKGPIRVLGISMFTCIEKTLAINYESIENQIKNVLQIWSQRALTIFGKVIVVKSHALSKLIYMLSVLPSPKLQVIKNVQSIIYKFLWNNKPERIKRSVLLAPKAEGGINMTDIVTQNYSLKIAWVKRIILNDNETPTWSTFITTLFGKVKDYFWECNLKYEDVSKSFNIKNMFSKEIIEAWCRYHFCNFENIKDIRDQIIWYNSHIKVNKQVLRYNSWIEKGVMRIRDIILDDGTVLSHNQFQSKYNIRVNFLQYAGVVKSIPKEWKVALIIDQERKIAQTKSKIQNILTLPKVSKFVYKKLIESKIERPDKCIEKWKNDLTMDIEIEKWRQFCSNVYTVSQIPHQQYFQYKLLNRILTTNEQLNKWGIVDSELCVLCDEEIETIKHMFLECEVVKLFYRDLENWISKAANFTFEFSNAEFLFGSGNPDFVLLDQVYLSAKQYIYHCRCNRLFPKLYVFKEKILFQKDIERHIFRNKGKLNYFENKWHGID
jgi:hypothetical protein